MGEIGKRGRPGPDIRSSAWSGYSETGDPENMTIDGQLPVVIPRMMTILPEETIENRYVLVTQSLLVKADVLWSHVSRDGLFHVESLDVSCSTWNNLDA